MHTRTNVKRMGSITANFVKNNAQQKCPFRCISQGVTTIVNIQLLLCLLKDNDSNALNYSVFVFKSIKKRLSENNF